MNYALVWREGARLKCNRLTSIPRSLSISTKKFVRSGKGFGDADYLRDSEGFLVGFSFFVSNEERDFVEKLSISNPLDNWLLLFVKQVSSYKIECVQAVGSELFIDENFEVAIAIPDWGMDPLGFEMQEMKPQ